MFDHAKWGPDNMKKALKKRDEELGGSSGQGPSGMDTEGCNITINIRNINKDYKHILNNYTSPSQVGTGRSRLRRDQERIPST